MLLFGHAGEVHEETVETVRHSLSTEWYFSLAVFLVSLSVLVAAVYFASKRSTTAAYMTLLAGLLIGGVSMYSISPVVSIVALTSGFGLALVSVLASVGQG